LIARSSKNKKERKKGKNSENKEVRMGNEEEEGNLHCISWKEGKFKGRDGCPG
jgi:hypothetical protein